MNCAMFLRQIHEFIDNRLEGAQANQMAEHLARCSECTRVHRDLTLIRDSLAGRSHLGDVSTALLIRELREENKGLASSVAEIWDSLRTTCRDFDRRIFWSRVSAAPAAAAMFFAMLSLFSPFFSRSAHDSLGFLVVSTTTSEITQPQVTNAEIRQSPQQFQEWMNTARRLPYEDSLSLVAAVAPGGTLTIDNVLEYPKSNDLLSAVDAALTSGQFEGSGASTSSFVIFSYQKIDVYGQIGL